MQRYKPKSPFVQQRIKVMYARLDELEQQREVLRQHQAVAFYECVMDLANHDRAVSGDAALAKEIDRYKSTALRPKQRDDHKQTPPKRKIK
jgi:hypothetical protein